MRELPFRGLVLIVLVWGIVLITFRIVRRVAARAKYYAGGVFLALNTETTNQGVVIRT